MPQMRTLHETARFLRMNGSTGKPLETAPVPLYGVRD
ncbi:hypothetical protein TcasGA2_TC003804 [Tribolium castaneum]|uniref:Uncharacterized protein n=1 Tax=Tribolium castaneum TaxID=7070 RepID=D6WF31_TRICA|nr:hypothetical protein TcasGA2_TC003804 [Tribolium castaneum]